MADHPGMAVALGDPVSIGRTAEMGAAVPSASELPLLIVAVAAACAPRAVLPNTGVKLICAELGSDKASPARDVQRQPKAYLNANQTYYINITSSVPMIRAYLPTRTTPAPRLPG